MVGRAVDRADLPPDLSEHATHGERLLVSAAALVDETTAFQQRSSRLNHSGTENTQEHISNAL
jgi:hypothetical protein